MKSTNGDLGTGQSDQKPVHDYSRVYWCDLHRPGFRSEALEIAIDEESSGRLEVGLGWDRHELVSLGSVEADSPEEAAQKFYDAILNGLDVTTDIGVVGQIRDKPGVEILELRTIQPRRVEGVRVEVLCPDYRQVFEWAGYEEYKDALMDDWKAQNARELRSVQELGPVEFRLLGDGKPSGNHTWRSHVYRSTFKSSPHGTVEVSVSKADE